MRSQGVRQHDQVFLFFFCGGRGGLEKISTEIFSICNIFNISITIVYLNSYFLFHIMSITSSKSHIFDG